MEVKTTKYQSHMQVTGGLSFEESCKLKEEMQSNFYWNRIKSLSD